MTGLGIDSVDATAGPALGQVRRSATAEIVCAQRAAESFRPAGRRLIDDPYARHFVDNRVYRILTANRATAALTRAGFDHLYPGFMAVVLLRNRWFEETLAAALDGGLCQVVLLGAGFDTTSMRLDLGRATLFEVDAGPTQRVKRDIIRRAGLAPRAQIRYVECDFERDSLQDLLVGSGFDPTAPALVAWWGVSFFLTEDAVRATASDIAALSAPGSVFTFDYLDESVVDGSTRLRGAVRARAAVARRGEPYRFGLTREGANQFGRPFGFTAEHNLSIVDLAARYAGPHGFPYSTDDFFGVLTLRRDAA